MLWARMLAYVTGMVNQELLERKRMFGGNWILRGKIRGRLLLSEGDKVTLAEIGQRPSPIRSWDGIGSSSRISSMDRDFANVWLTISTYIKDAGNLL
jgi:hypothetical protein